jgi:sugar (pentulose or hexulose) kinase
MKSTSVIAVFDIGKTNKKIFLFDSSYKIVFERSVKFVETVDEDGDPCEDIERLRLFIFDSLKTVSGLKEFNIKAINFCAYGASFVYIDKGGNTLTPLYNYLKPYPENLQKTFYNRYGGEEKFSLETASPVLGSLNSGMQVYRLKHEKTEIYKRTQYALHLPQYLSYLLSAIPCSEITSIGCHTGLWDFINNDYHNWVYKEGISEKFPPVQACNKVEESVFPGISCLVGSGLHDSSAALIPYLLNFNEPFILLSTGTWCISLNPFNTSALTAEELKNDCLCYLTYLGKPVKASRLFAGNEHEQQVKRIAAHFGQKPEYYTSITYDAGILNQISNKQSKDDFRFSIKESAFPGRDLGKFSSDIEAYHQLISDLVRQQIFSTGLVLNDTKVKKIFVDGGFSKNSVYMNMLAAAMPDLEVFAASMAQATALGSALAIHYFWNKSAMPNDMIELKYYSGQLEKTK